MRPKSAMHIYQHDKFKKDNSKTNLHYKVQGKKSSTSIVPAGQSDTNHPTGTLDINSPPPKNVSTCFSTKDYWGGRGIRYTPGFFSTILFVVDKSVFSAANLLDVLSEL